MIVLRQARRQWQLIVQSRRLRLHEAFEHFATL